jgi:hypothetical protein
MGSRRHPAWLFPVPVRASRFQASDQRWGVYNEVALDKIKPFAFDGGASPDAVLFYDHQTHLENNTPGRLGSGRGGVYRGRYLKGVGGTPPRTGTTLETDITEAVIYRSDRRFASV